MNPVLYHELVTADGPAPENWLLVLHGIYGSGRNWSSVAKKFIQQHSDWGVILVDLRAHGKSQGFEPPHTIAAVADDLSQLVQACGWRPRVVLGHSFGGKVALVFGSLRSVDLEQIWVIDATPRAMEPGGLAWKMALTLRQLPSAFTDREQLVELLRDRGMSQPISTWMAMNLDRVDDRFVWRIAVDTIESLLKDYFSLDVWSATQESAQRGVKIQFVKALQSEVIGDDLSRAILDLGEATRCVNFHPVEGGHMLNVDNPTAIVELLRQHL